MDDRAPMDRRQVIAGLAMGVAGAGASPAAAQGRPLFGANVIQTPNALFGSAKAAESFRRLADMGATRCSIVPFLYQADPKRPAIAVGADPTLAQVAAGVRQAKAAGLGVTVKPHVWVPSSWAGEIAIASDADWPAWFAAFRQAVGACADIAAAEGAEQFCAGVEVRGTVHRSAWRGVIEDARSRFKGRLGYCAHGAEEAERVPFWSDLDFVGVTLYPVLGGDHAKAAWRAAMRTELARVEAVAARADKPVQVLEVGLRSAVGAAAKPWESAEERVAATSQGVQAEVLAEWMAQFARPNIAEVQVWRWFSDPDAGGPRDTDFTIQGKTAERRLRALWRRR